MNAFEPIDIFVERLKKIGITVELSSNVPWVYINKINGKRVIEKYRSKYFFTIAFIPYRPNEPTKFTDISEIFNLLRKYV